MFAKIFGKTTKRVSETLRTGINYPKTALERKRVLEFPETDDSLIALVQNPSDRIAWEQFERIYRPVIFRIARAKGMQHSDALDVVQQVLISVATAIGRYRPTHENARFRNWLSRVTKNAILKFFRNAKRDVAVGGTVMLDYLSEVPCDVDDVEALISVEYRREVFRIAAAQVRAAVHEQTWLAFELTTLQNIPVANVAVTLNLSVGSVYAARSRIMRKLRHAVKECEEQEGKG